MFPKVKRMAEVNDKGPFARECTQTCSTKFCICEYGSCLCFFSLS